MIDVSTLAWVAVTSELAGNWLIGDKVKYGFLVKLIGSASWLAVAVLSAMNGLAVSAILGAFISVRNFREWGK